MRNNLRFSGGEKIKFKLDNEEHDGKIIGHSVQQDRSLSWLVYSAGFRGPVEVKDDQITWVETKNEEMV